jgi:integrase/recombinase XerD
MVILVILEESFEKWLRTMGYASSTVDASTRYVRDFLEWLQMQSIKDLDQVDGQVINTYYRYLQSRKNKRQAGSLSVNYIINNIDALKRFSRYLQETGRGRLEINLRLRTTPAVSMKAVLTREEIMAMYAACRTGKEDLEGMLAMRDRAILGIYYGCGLRRSEGIALNVSDVQLKEKLVYVRKGKNYRERYVPMSETVREDLQSYIQVARKKILSFKRISPEALFLSMRVQRLCSNQIIRRVQQLASSAGIHKDIGLHSLRHSIATHLLQSGMILEDVSQFLGHSSLESTQIYTHIINEQEPGL